MHYKAVSNGYTADADGILHISISALIDSSMILNI